MADARLTQSTLHEQTPDAPAILDLVKDRLWQCLDRALHHHRIIRPVLGGTRHQRPVDDCGIVHAFGAERALRLGCMGFVFFNGHHGVGQLRDNGRGIAKAAADIEHQFIRLNIQRIQQLGQCARLQHHTPCPKRHVFAHIGRLAQRTGHINLARGAQHGGNDREFGDIRWAHLRVDHHHPPCRKVSHHHPLQAKPTGSESQALLWHR